MRIESGQGDTSGDVSIRTADSNSDGNGEGNTGALRLKSGAAVVGNSGSVLVGSGQTATGSGGDVTVAVGASGSGALVGATPLSFPLYIFYGWWFLLPSRRNCSFHCFLFSSCSFFTFFCSVLHPSVIGYLGFAGTGGALRLQAGDAASATQEQSDGGSVELLSGAGLSSSGAVQRPTAKIPSYPKRKVHNQIRPLID